MSNVAKFFIVINFVLSVVFLGSAATLLSQKWDYRQIYLDKTYEYELDKQKLNDSLSEAQAHLTHFSEYLSEAKALAKEAGEKNIRITKENESLRRKNQEFSISLANISTDIKEINNRLEKKENRISELESARDRQKEVAEESIKAKEEALDEQQRMEIQLSNLQGELAEKRNALQRSAKELWEAKQIIRAVREAGVNIPSLFKRAKPLDGRIVAVSSRVPLVMVSLGTDDGIQKGYQFTVYRGSTFVGRIVIEEPYKDMSAARIIKKMTVRDIKKGDSATTRIGGGGNF